MLAVAQHAQVGARHEGPVPNAGQQPRYLGGVVCLAVRERSCGLGDVFCTKPLRMPEPEVRERTARGLQLEGPNKQFSGRVVGK